LPQVFQIIPWGTMWNSSMLVHRVASQLQTGVNADNFTSIGSTTDGLNINGTFECCWSSTTGQWSLSGSEIHAGSALQSLIAYRGAWAVVAAEFASGNCESVCSFPTGTATATGPVISAAARDGTNPKLVHLTITPGAGTDIVGSPTAQLAHGFGVSVNSGAGYPSASFANFVMANQWSLAGPACPTNCSATRIDATHIDILFPVTTAGFGWFWYPNWGARASAIGSTNGWVPQIGPNNAWVDNYCSLAPAGWNPSEANQPCQNFPLASPLVGVTIP
jgi:hypothetical protein